MTNEIQTFTNSKFGIIRAIHVHGEPWFVAKDVCEALGIRTNTVRTILDHDEVTNTNVNSIDIAQNGGRTPLIVSEPGLYSLILKSRKPEAKAFQRWVTHEVLPALRRDGAYIASNDTEDDTTLIARALLAAKRQIDAKNHNIEQQNREINEMSPKALFADAVAASDGTCLVGELAKMLRQNGVKIGQNRLFAMLREDGYLGKTGSNRNVPTQSSMEKGLFRIKETAITHSDGHVSVNRTPKVTGKGQRYFIERYSKAGRDD